MPWKANDFKALVIAEGVIMIIGNWILLNSHHTYVKALSAGSATHTVGYHSPPHLGPKIAFYDGPDQMLLEKVC